MNFRRLKDNLLSLNHLRKFAGFIVLKNAWGSGFKLKIMTRPPRGRVLVLSPHPDDDALGCGGALKLHARQGDRIKVIYLFDGSGGISTSPRRRLMVVKKREAEAYRAAQILGIHELEFWHISDGTLSSTRTAMRKLARVCRAFHPTTIYAPSFLDPHPDHFITAKILADYLAQNNFKGEIFSYEIWAPQFVNRLLCVDGVMNNKIQAIKAHQSQLKAWGYLDAMVGLARYRAGMFNAGHYAEGFLVCRRKLYLSLSDLIKRH